MLIGEASHGTHEFYHARAEITKRLIVEKGFNAVAVEADWPDAYRVNRYVRGHSNDPDADRALSGFKRFPTWMWRNRVVVQFVEWLRQHNQDVREEDAKTGFYGLDLYSLNASIEAVLAYLDRVDPQAARKARRRYACFEDFRQDNEGYGYAADIGLAESCEDEAIAQLVELQKRAAEYAQRDGRIAEEDVFSAEQNARLIRNAEEYYRSMFRGRVSSWNLRDRHMMETLRALLVYFAKRVPQPRVVIWAHNSHLGDARYTEMGERGELNLGELVREDFGHNAVLIGFTTYTGSVTAASDWGAPAERKRVRPALRDSYEDLFHNLKLPAFLLDMRDDADVHTELRERRLERAMGVIYRPETERFSHYFEAALSDQFDAVIHYDETQAVEPLEPSATWRGGEPPETFPTGV
ncbi:MAG TPA: erythromycin esterase family protein [Candidatus Binatia bacterium]|nr:erythromycin esterase family protein [Candidatus Binatia bacterium]